MLPATRCAAHNKKLLVASTEGWQAVRSIHLSCIDDAMQAHNLCHLDGGERLLIAEVPARK